MRFILSVTLAFLMGISPAMAKSCYSKAEAEAEQGIRIHSELMVIGLNCQHMTPAGWPNFYSQYRQITNRHADLFSGYEKTLISYYRRNGSGNAERKMHDMRTAFANKVSSDAARMRPDVFCANYAPRIPRAAKMSRADFQEWASTMHPSHPLNRPVCN